MLTRASVWVKEAVTKGHVVCGPVRVQRPPGGTRKAEGGSRTPKPGGGGGADRDGCGTFQNQMLVAVAQLRDYTAPEGP